MNRRIASSKSKELASEKRINKLIIFVEELVWLLKSTKINELQDAVYSIRNEMYNYKNVKTISKEYSPSNPNKSYLIGVLPGLFQDSSLFSKNEDIADFANEALGIRISRVEKRSKYELIGLVVCEATELNDEKLNSLVEA